MRAVRDVVGVQRVRGHGHFFFDSVAVDEVRGQRAEAAAAQLLVRREERRDGAFAPLFAADEIPEGAVGGEHGTVGGDDGDRR